MVWKCFGCSFVPRKLVGDAEAVMNQEATGFRRGKIPNIDYVKLHDRHLRARLQRAACDWMLMASLRLMQFGRPVAELVETPPRWSIASPDSKLTVSNNSRRTQSEIPLATELALERLCLKPQAEPPGGSRQYLGI